MASNLIAPITIARSAPLSGMALGYDGKASYLAVGQLLVGQPFSTFSFEAWVYLADATKSGALWSNNDGSFSLHFLGGTTTAQMQISVGTTTLTFPYGFAAAQWYYIVITYDTPTIGLWVNTKPQQGVSADYNPVVMGPARIGASAGSASLYYHGSIGMVRVWKGLLDAATIAQLQYMMLWGPTTMTGTYGQAVLAANWHCNEGYGDVAFDYSGDVDASLGGVDPLARPGWEVSTILKPPDFITLETVITPAQGPEALKIKMAFPPRAARADVPAARPAPRPSSLEKERLRVKPKPAPSKGKR